MRSFFGSGGLGDAAFVLSKLRVCAAPGDRLVFLVERKCVGQLVAAFLASQHVQFEIRCVPEIDAYLRRHRARGEEGVILNTAWRGFSWIQPWRSAVFPCDCRMPPRCPIVCGASPVSRPYILVQTNAGTIRYGRGKNWERLDWINALIAGWKKKGWRVVATGTENPGLVGVEERLGLEMPQLLGLINDAHFVLGLQGFVTICALLMGKRVLLKRENLLVTINHMHPMWRSHSLVFREPCEAGGKAFSKIRDKADAWLVNAAEQS